MLSGFQVGHQLKQRSESALCSLLPVHNPGFLLLSGGVLAESVQRNGIVFDATSAQAGTCLLSGVGRRQYSEITP